MELRARSGEEARDRARSALDAVHVDANATHDARSSSDVDAAWGDALSGLVEMAQWAGVDLEGVLRERAATLRDSIRAVASMGVRVFCGPLFKPVGDTDQSMSLDRQRRETIKALGPIVREAGEAGVVFAFEPLNRFETNFLNTVADSLAFCRALNHPSAGLLLDTFHMHIEEKDSAAAIAATAKAGKFAHFHVSENDRGQAGSGQVRWPAVAEAVRKAKYDGWVVLESFSQTNQAIKTAVSCWRPFYSSPKKFMSGGLAFVRKLHGLD